MDDQAPGIGHNMPDTATALQDRADQLATACNAWHVAVPEIETEDQEKKAADLLARISAELKEAENTRKAEKEPHRIAAQAVDDTYNPIKDKLEAIKKLFTPKLTAWMNKKEAARKEAARRALEEADRKLAEAEAAQKAAEQAQASRDGVDVVGATLDADTAQKAAKQAAKDAAKIAKTTTKAKGNYGGRAISLRPTYSAKITNLDAAIDHYRDHPKMADLIQELANAWARSPEQRQTPIPGVELKEETKAA